MCVNVLLLSVRVLLPCLLTYRPYLGEGEGRWVSLATIYRSSVYTAHTEDTEQRLAHSISGAIENRMSVPPGHTV